MARVVAFGEILLRLKPPGHERLLQSPVLEATFGGGEANVAVSLAQFGVPASFVTAVPPNDLGDAALAELRRHGVDVSRARRQGERLGIYFLEAGSNQRPSRVVYDRAHSSIATARPGDFDWDEALDGAEWLHLTGITPALSETAAALALEAAREARQRGLQVSCDFSYRASLWRWGRSPAEVMPDLVRQLTVWIANEEDCRSALGIELGPEAGEGAERQRALAERVMAKFPNLRRHAITLRESHSADHNGWAACLYDGRELLQSRRYQITDIVDRVGAGDAFVAGLIFGLLDGADDRAALEFATAAGCLKHTVPGDFSRLRVAEVQALVAGDAAGRVQR